VYNLPWKNVISSPAILSTFAAQFGTNWFVFTLQTGVSLYMDDVLKFSLKEVIANHFVLILFAQLISNTRSDEL